MISLLNDAPENVAAFSASCDISLTDFDNIIIPHVEKKMERFNELNYLLYLNTDLPKTDVDVWLSQSLLKLNKISSCNRAAIISDDYGLQKITALYTNKFRIFSTDNIYAAMYWCNNGH